MDNLLKLVFFKIENQQFALPINTVDRIIQVVEMIKMPDSPQFLKGFINVHGELIPVLNLRYLFGIIQSDLEITDHIIILKSGNSAFGLLTDSVEEIKDVNEQEFVKSEKLSFRNRYFKGIIKTETDIIVIHEPQFFLNEKELEEISMALEKIEEGITNQDEK